MTSPLRRDALLRLKVETDLARAVETTARQRGQTMSEFTRQSLRAHLARHGVRLGPDDGPRTPPAAPPSLVQLEATGMNSSRSPTSASTATTAPLRPTSASAAAVLT